MKGVYERRSTNHNCVDQRGLAGWQHFGLCPVDPSQKMIYEFAQKLVMVRKYFKTSFYKNCN